MTIIKYNYKECINLYIYNTFINILSKCIKFIILIANIISYNEGLFKRFIKYAE